MKNMNTKVYTICLIAIFLGSLVPLAFADQGSDDSINESDDSDSDDMYDDSYSNSTSNDSSSDDAYDDGPDDDSYSGNSSDSSSSKIITNAEREAAREAIKKRMELVKGTMKESRERAKLMKEERKDFMEQMKEDRKARLEVLKDARSAKKSGDMNTTVDKFKEFLSLTADQWMAELSELKAKIQESNLSDAQKSDIIATIDLQIAEINATKATIDSATTKEELKDAAKMLKETKADHYRRAFSLRVLSARVQGHINKAESLEKRLEQLESKAAEKGINISAEVDAFNAYIDLASQKNKQAQDQMTAAIAYIKAGDKEQAKTAMDEAHKLLKEAAEALKDARDELKSIVSKLKSAKVDIEPSPTNSTNSSDSS